MHAFHEFEPGIHVVCGPMFAGKTSEFIRRLRRADVAGRKIQVFRPFVDQRYALDRVTTHDGVHRHGCTFVQSAAAILPLLHPDTQCVAVEEVQFFDAGVIDVANELAARGVHVLCNGLDTDFRAVPFGPMGSLLAVADSVTKLRAICAACKRPSATLTQRLIGGKPACRDDPVVLVAGADAYEARCRSCFCIREGRSEGIVVPQSTTQDVVVDKDEEKMSSPPAQMCETPVYPSPTCSKEVPSGPMDTALARAPSPAVGDNPPTPRAAPTTPPRQAVGFQSPGRRPTVGLRSPSRCAGEALVEDGWGFGVSAGPVRDVVAP
eukprot:TRINITY_DN24203_c0_g1_i1.p1 TRINITY_DN24203_c0_g1~~TRINITY_DN24203_c0_g1_i1.p1  ORF type:complete len:322 (+),score=23.01 TRINITY_DN24203_c0_g1_i1:90-1055(+)